MARGKRTDLITALAVKALSELGYWPALIADLLHVAPRTVADIVEGRGQWQQLLLYNAEFDSIKTQFKLAMDEAAVALAIQTIQRLTKKLETATFAETLGLLKVLPVPDGWRAS